MTLKNTFVCNVCRSENENVNTVIGLKWKGNELDEEAAVRANTHLCLNCWRALQAFAESRKAKGYT